MGSIAVNENSTLEFQSCKQELHDVKASINRRQNIKNVFVFSQLTNVVQPITQMGQYQICKHTVFEVVKLKKDSQKCL